MGEAQASARLIGTVTSCEVMAFCDSVGLDTMPYPFVFRSAADTFDGMLSEVRAARDRLLADPPRQFTRWLQASMQPDLSLQLYGVFPQDGPTADPERAVLINAVRQGDDGFVAIQKPSPRTGASGDVVVYRVESVHLSRAVTRLAPDAAAGRLGPIVLERSADYESVSGSFMDRNDDAGGKDEQRYRASEVTFSAFVQVCPFRLKDWAFDRDAFHVHWEHRADDGQYILERTPQGRTARAADRTELTRCIDVAVVKALNVVREERNRRLSDAYVAD